LVRSEVGKIYAEAANKLVKVAEPFGRYMAEQIEVKEPKDFDLMASMYYGSLAIANMLCNQLVDPEEVSKCVVPIYEAQERVLTKLRELFSK
jgi:hypothetical protein